jgi:hypothetical protein
LGEANTTEARYFIVWKAKVDPDDLSNNLLLAVEVNDLVDLSICSIRESQPRLYRDFPLIGSEKFYLPFILNGKRFFPTEERDGLYLNDDGANAKANRYILEQAFVESLKFISWLVERNAKSLFNAIQCRIPDYRFEPEIKNWYIDNLQSNFRQELFGKRLVETPKGNAILGEVKFPYFDGTEEDNATIWELSWPHLGLEFVPLKNHLNHWIKAFGPKEESENWPHPLRYLIEDLLESIGLNINLNNVAFDDQLSGEKIHDGSRITWLNEIYRFLESKDLLDLLNRHKVVPNFRQDLFVHSILWEESKEAPLPDSYLDILAKLTPESDWRNELVYRDIEIPKKGHKERTMSMLTTAINDILKPIDPGNREFVFLRRVDSVELLMELHAIHAPGVQEDSFHERLLEGSKTMFHIDPVRRIEKQYADFNIEIAHRLLIVKTNITINDCKNVDNLAQILQTDSNGAILWLDAYFQLLDGSKLFAKYLEEGPILPNRYGNFCQYYKISNYGNENQELDDELIRILAALNPSKDWLPKLLQAGISIRVKETLSFDELVVAIEEEVKKIHFDNDHSKYSEPLLALIDWVENFKEWKGRAFAYFETITGQVYYAITIENSANRAAIMSLLRRPEQLKLIAQIADSGVDIAQLLDLVKLFPNGIPAKVMQFCKDEAEKKRDFDTRLVIGTKLELLFMDAMNKKGLNLLIEKVSTDDFDFVHAGGGAYDFRITNPVNNKTFLLEMKSVAFENTEPIHLAISQMLRAVKVKEMFGIIAIERPENKNDLSVDYLIANIRFVYNPGEFLNDVADDYQQVYNRVNSTQQSRLQMSLDEMKCRVDYGFILSRALTFLKMIDLIATNLS